MRPRQGTVSRSVPTGAEGAGAVVQRGGRVGEELEHLGEDGHVEDGGGQRAGRGEVGAEGGGGVAGVDVDDSDAGEPVRVVAGENRCCP